MHDALLIEERPHWWSDRRAELTLGALACGVLAVVLAMLVFVVTAAWPSFAHKGLHWFGPGRNVDNQIGTIFLSGDQGGPFHWQFHAWPLLWSTILTTGAAVAISFFCSVVVALFIIEFAPSSVRNILQPVIGPMDSVPSVIYGLIGVLVGVPFIGNHLITESQKQSVAYAISLNGYSLLAAVLILTVMISPIMISIFCDGLRAVPRTWAEASLGLGVNRWRTYWKIAVRTARPALIAGTVLATARALGEAVMLAMVSGSVGFTPNPFDGIIFLVEPSRPLAPTIITNADALATPNGKATLFAIASVLLFSAAMLSFAGWAAKQSMKKYGAS